MKAYIQSAASLTAQATLESLGMPEEFANLSGTKLKGLDPDYKKFISPIAARRMGRIIKMGVASAMVCMDRAEEKNPDAIIIGTAMGCVEDTEDFLLKMIDNNETLLTPTSFIQSTHNTVGGQIALLIGCNNYNFTYVHRGFSFESALLDGMLLLKEGEANKVLVGGLDEVTQNHFDIYNKLGNWKTSSSSIKSIEEKGHGILPGEGSSFFMISNKKDENTLAKILGMEMVYQANDASIRKAIEKLLADNKLNITDIDLLIPGLNGHIEEEKLYADLLTVFSEKSVAGFKHYSGEFPTASGVGLYFAAYVLKNQKVPDLAWIGKHRTQSISHILLCNNLGKDYFSIQLISRC
jgi:3-oxoacyl-[acyl-carrier-protein] synthase II